MRFILFATLLSPSASYGLLSRRGFISAVATAESAAAATAISPISSAQQRSSSLVKMAANHAIGEVDVSGTRVPVALWYPKGVSPSVGEARGTYSYVIDIGGIARNFRVGWLLGWLPRKEFSLPPSGSIYDEPSPSSSAAQKPGDAIIFTHGFLGSPLDMSHVCEALAERGFTVAAPEFPESLCASFKNPDGISRAEIVAATRELVDGGRGVRWGLFGHSAGAGTTLKQPGTFSLGRCALCPGYRGYEESDPLLVIASEGDAVNQLLVSNGVDVQVNLRAEAEAGRVTTMYTQASDVYAEKSPPQRGALIYKDGGALPAGATQLPNHISFLWTGVDEAMIELLSPFLPVAKALRLFVLDFDTYLEARDAEVTAADVAPAVLRFFAANSRR